MSDRRRRMYVSNISSNTVTLSPDALGGPDHPGAGLGIAQLRIVTTESTPDATFWRSAAACGRFEVIIKTVS